MLSSQSDSNIRHDRDEVKRAADIVGFIGGYLNLRKSGAEFVGLCPFHKEKTPSFYVNPAKQVYHCYGCGAGGDVIKFAQTIENLNFPDTLKLLGDHYGVSISGAKPTKAAKRAWRKDREERELIEHFRLMEFIPIDRAAIEYARQPRRYKAWLKRDLANAHAVTAAIVAMLALAQARDGDYPKETAA